MLISRAPLAPRSDAHRIVAGALVVVFFFACGCSRTPAGATSAALPPSVVASMATTESESLRRVLDLFEAGDEQRAVEEFIEIASEQDVSARLGSLRLWNISEAEFGRQIREMDRKQAAMLHQEMLDSFESLRAFSRRVLEIASEASKSGDITRARTLFDAVEQCANANRGPESEVTLLASTVGDSINKAVAQTRARLP